MELQNTGGMEACVAVQSLIRGSLVECLKSTRFFLCVFLLVGQQTVLVHAQPATVINSNQPAPADHSGRNSPRGTGALPDLEPSLHAFPAVLGLDGKRLADGDCSQWVEGGFLHAVITYDFGPHHRIQEKAVFRQEPKLTQQEWSWREWRDGRLQRHFEVNFATGKAGGEKREASGLKRWSEILKIEPGRTFAGFGFTLAIKALRERLMKGGKIELEAVAFGPKPRIVPVDISFGGLDQIEMVGRTLKGDRFIIHPKIPLVARPFVDVHDTRIWLTAQRPAGFLRWEGNIVEPDDPIIRVDRFSGKENGTAEGSTKSQNPKSKTQTNPNPENIK